MVSQERMEPIPRLPLQGTVPAEFAQMAHGDHPVHQVLLEHPDHEVEMAPTAETPCPATLDPLDHPDPQERVADPEDPARRDHPVNPENEERRDHPDQRDHPDHQDHPAPLAKTETQATQDRKDLQALQARTVNLADPETMDTQAHPVHLAHLERMPSIVPARDDLRPRLPSRPRPRPLKHSDSLVPGHIIFSLCRLSFFAPAYVYFPKFKN
jgi:hypothetical protein